MATKKRFKTELWGGDMDMDVCAIRLPFDPQEAFGKVRAPVVVTIQEHSFRSTVARMDGCDFVVVNKKNRAAAGVDTGDAVTVTMELDTAPRTVTVPPDLAKALRGNRVARTRWAKLSYTHQREHVEAIEEAKRAETRARRIAKAVSMLAVP
jgi:hypothetical protein